MSGREVREVYCGAAGASVEGINSRGVVAVTGRGREITREDVDRVIEAARAVVIPMDREVLHVIPQSFIVDDQKGIRNPLDMIGVRLEAEVHIITGSVTTAQNLVKCVNRAGFKVNRLMLQSLAAARAVLSSDEKELGCLLVDLGGGTTDVLVYSRRRALLLERHPRGRRPGDERPLDHAERAHGRGRAPQARVGLGLDRVRGERRDRDRARASAAGRPRRRPRRGSAPSSSRAWRKSSAWSRERVEKMGHWKHIKGGVVLTGGGALMQGVGRARAGNVPDARARGQSRSRSGGLVEEYRSPALRDGGRPRAHGRGRVGSLRRIEGRGPAEGRLRPERQGKAKAPAREGGGALGRFADWMRKGFF